MRASSLYLLASILFFGCSYIHKGGSEGPVQYDTLRIPKSESEYYFQLKASRYDSINNAVDTFRNQWFSHFLFRMKEPIIHEYKGTMEIYRSTWLRTFHHPVILRLEKKEDSVRLISKVAEGAGGYYCGEMLLDTIQSISIENYDSLIDEIENANFWQLPSDMRLLGNDGSEWIIEAYQSGRYHLVYRFSPVGEDKPSISRIGNFLTQLSQLSDESKELY